MGNIISSATERVVDKVIGSVGDLEPSKSTQHSLIDYGNRKFDFMGKQLIGNDNNYTSTIKDNGIFVANIKELNAQDAERVILISCDIERITANKTENIHIIFGGECKSLEAENATHVILLDCKMLENVHLPNLKNGALKGCNSIKEFNAPNLTKIMLSDCSEDVINKVIAQISKLQTVESIIIDGTDSTEWFKKVDKNLNKDKIVTAHRAEIFGATRPDGIPVSRNTLGVIGECLTSADYANFTALNQETLQKSKGEKVKELLSLVKKRKQGILKEDGTNLVTGEQMRNI